MIDVDVCARTPRTREAGPDQRTVESTRLDSGKEGGTEQRVAMKRAEREKICSDADLTEVTGYGGNRRSRRGAILQRSLRGRFCFRRFRGKGGRRDGRVFDREIVVWFRVIGKHQR